MATKAKTTKRGGARAGAGRKPKAITLLREQLVAPLVIPAEDGPGPAIQAACRDLAGRKTAAQYALDLFEKAMRDEGKPLDIRLDCAREVLNRTIGKPRTAETPAKDEGDGEQVHIYMPDNGRGARTG